MPWTLDRHGCYVASSNELDDSQDSPDLVVMTDFQNPLVDRPSVIYDRVSVACYTRPNVIVVVYAIVPSRSCGQQVAN
jgi:hypothetical protein